MGVGYADTPGIWSDEQVRGWKWITEAVHAEGGRILLQLWHVGRISDPMFLDGKLPVAPSGDGRLAQPHSPQRGQRTALFCIELLVLHPHLPAILLSFS
jgi:2,4-dienoyl-CoA reductase-like NADH-dependent reductase (Old Yellow Enzyme family)